MERSRALAVLGLDSGASTREIESAYASKSRVLKRRIVAAKSVGERNEHRRVLADLIRIRDVALGPEAAKKRRDKAQRKKTESTDAQDWWHPGLGVPDNVTDRKGALDFFGLSPYSDEKEIRRVFFSRSRALKHEIAHADIDDVLAGYRRALRRLNGILELALQAPPATQVIAEAPPSNSDPEDETLTDFVDFSGHRPGPVAPLTPGAQSESEVAETRDDSRLVPPPREESEVERTAKRPGKLGDSVFEELEILPSDKKKPEQQSG